MRCGADATSALIQTCGKSAEATIESSGVIPKRRVSRVGDYLNLSMGQGRFVFFHGERLDNGVLGAMHDEGGLADAEIPLLERLTAAPSEVLPGSKGQAIAVGSGLRLQLRPLSYIFALAFVCRCESLRGLPTAK